VLAKRRDSSVIGTPETLWCPEMEVPELELSLDLGERDNVFPPIARRSSEGERRRHDGVRYILESMEERKSTP
jgi:hypothetical protein